MDILGLGLQEDVERELGVRFLKEGISMHTARQNLSLLEKIQSKPPSVCIFSPEGRDALLDLARALTALKSVNPEVQLVALAKDSSLPGLDTLSASSNFTVVSEQGQLEQLVENLRQRVLSLNPDFRERRRHIRIEPREQDRALFNFKMPNSDESVEGEVVNLSLGGGLLRLKNPDVNHRLNPRDVIEGLQLNVNYRLMLTDATVVVTRDDEVGIRFYNCRDQFVRLLSYYILETLSYNDN